MCTTNSLTLTYVYQNVYEDGNCFEMNRKSGILRKVKKGGSVKSLSKHCNVEIFKCNSTTFSGPCKKKTAKASELPKMKKKTSLPLVHLNAKQKLACFLINVERKD